MHTSTTLAVSGPSGTAVPAPSPTTTKKPPGGGAPDIGRGPAQAGMLAATPSGTQAVAVASLC